LAELLRPLEGEDDRAWIVRRHGRLYAEEEGWDAGFEALVAGVVADLAARDGSTRDAAWIAEVDGRRAGCVACMAHDDRTAKLRLLLVEPWARGRDVGRALVDQCIAFAREAGYDELELWTTDNLIAARGLYESSGFELVREYPESRFGAEFVSLDFALALR
jgi:N-acetylglutamate synthase-like GNAT family acetyltransferase